ncbi:helix-turn-helix domain-containing protein [Arcticibacter svalbardensis]|uniref:helix-turn-helix domain-containing protein n=1 Tax=Arcticibacter svalbardensis TaxID=1288027 RepID=UPI00058CC307|nr:helix-turn-helix transcriptional regulator [Arcticibacter svalbardensis]
MITIGQTLQKLWESNGVTISSIAKAAGLSTATYYNVERGYKEASFIVIFKICRFYESACMNLLILLLLLSLNVLSLPVSVLWRNCSSQTT